MIKLAKAPTLLIGVKMYRIDIIEYDYRASYMNLHKYQVIPMILSKGLWKDIYSVEIFLNDNLVELEHFKDCENYLEVLRLTLTTRAKEKLIEITKELESYSYNYWIDKYKDYQVNGLDGLYTIDYDKTVAEQELFLLFQDCPYDPDLIIKEANRSKE